MAVPEGFGTINSGEPAISTDHVFPECSMRQREFMLAVYLPTILLALGQGALLATLPLYAAELGFGYTLISVISAAAAIGTLVTDVPAGALLHRIGLRRSMLIGAAMVVVGTLSLAFDMPAEAIVGVRVLAGIGTALWGLSRHAFIAGAVPIERRGSAIAMFGGINRIGIFGGPAIGGIVATAFGLQSSFILTGVMAMFAFVAAFLFVPADGDIEVRRRGGTATRWRIVRRTIREHAGDLGAAGVAQLFAQMIRQGRQLLIPLVGAQQLGLNAAEVGTVMTISAVVDMSMFFPAGLLMDRFGRKFASVPSFAIMAIGIGLVPFATSFTTLAAAGVVIGLGNGLGSGSMMTLGADLAPEGATGEFLGIWRLIGDVGMVIGPLVVGAIAGILSLDGSAYALSLAGFAASLTLAFLVQETRVSPKVPETT
jgi:MFS family permease